MIINATEVYLLTRKPCFTVNLLISFLLCLSVCAPAFAELRVASTIHSIGVEFDMPEDANENAGATIRYRKQGDSNWTAGLPLFRINFRGDDMLAGSILFLDPDTTYDIEVAISDPDGGDETRSFSATTNPIPVLPSALRTLHVVPGSTGGDGSEGNPFQGLETAWAQAKPGDTFLLHAGDYGFVQDENGASGTAQNPIAFKSFGDGDAIIRSLELYNQSHIWFEGLTFSADPDPEVVGDEHENGLYSVLRIDYEVFGTSHDVDNIVIVRNKFLGYKHSILAGSLTDNWYIADNTISGNQPLGGESFRGEGIELGEGNNHIVAHNSITLVADAISFPGENCDIYGNDIFDVTDDGIELDEGGANTRAWGNRIHNAGHNGISFSPMNGAPWYILRNQVINYQESAFKFRDPFLSDRFFAAHNTLINTNVITDHYTGRMLRGTMKNNLLVSVGDRRIVKRCDEDPTSETDWDYNGYDWGTNTYSFNCRGLSSDLAGFSNMLKSFGAAGDESNGIRVSWESCFESLNVPGPAPSTTIPPQHATLEASCNAVDAGVVLPNINDGYSGNAPDLGAYEIGQALPEYGPRRAQGAGIVPPAPPENLHILQ